VTFGDNVTARLQAQFLRICFHLIADQLDAGFVKPECVLI
jgi:hypothetical protein